MGRAPALRRSPKVSTAYPNRIRTKTTLMQNRHVQSIQSKFYDITMFVSGQKRQKQRHFVLRRQAFPLQREVIRKIISFTQGLMHASMYCIGQLEPSIHSVVFPLQSQLQPAFLSLLVHIHFSVFPHAPPSMLLPHIYFIVLYVHPRETTSSSR